MAKKFVTLMLAVCVLGVIALALNQILGNVINLSYKEQIGNTGLYWQRYDTWAYIQNLKNSFRNTTELSLNLPTREWEYSNSGWGWLSNDLALLLDYIILVINILLYPLRIGFYMVQIIMSLIGIDTINYANNPLKWLIDLTYRIKSLQIPYV